MPASYARTENFEYAKVTYTSGRSYYVKLKYKDAGTIYEVKNFDAKEWDKTACKESCFIWESDNPNDGEAYHTIIGYADEIQNEVKLKIPSRCHEIRCDKIYWNNSGRSFIKTTFDTIELPETITRIGYYAFSTFNLVSIIIPSSVMSIEEAAFAFCDDLTNITILNGVTSIGSLAFANCEGLTSIKIPDSVTSIGNTAFAHCTGLTSIKISDSMNSIGDYAFEDCTGLKSITIPDSVTSIGTNVFLSCTQLTSITIPYSVTNIGYRAFGDDALYPISDTAVYNVVKDSYADLWVQANKYGNQTINYITK